MAPWSTKRRLIYGGGVVLTLAIILSLLTWNFFYKAPTCNDGKKNGDEKGIDCGGSCNSLCLNDALAPVVLWSKIFNISGDVYSAVAFVENPNINSENNEATYQFKIYDTENQLIMIKEGVTSIPKNKKFAVFETGIIIKNSKPKSADFKFLSFAPWQKNMVKDPEISLKYGALNSTSTAPNITGTVINQSLQSIPKIELVVLVLDNKENAVAASRTFVDNLARNSSQDFVFTWPKPFNLGVESCTNPLDVAVVLDKSGSMKSESANPPEPFDTVKSTAQNFIKNLTDDDQVAVTFFGTNSKQESLLSADREMAENVIGNVFLSTTTVDQTNIFAGLTDAFNELKSTRAKTNSKKAIILLTDGIPTEPKQTGVQDYPSISAQTVAKEIKDSGIIMYTIGLGSNVSEGFLKEVSSGSSHYFFAPNKEKLTSIYEKITSDLCIRKPNVITVIHRFF